MLKEVADDKKIGKEIVQAAIKAVKEKGWDVNPYTVADEAKVSRTQLVRDSDLMNLISEAKGGAAPVPAPATPVAAAEATQARVKELEEKLSQLEQEHKGLLEETKRLEDECFEREDRILELEAKCTDLEHEAETLAVQLQNTWNVAYQKGLSDGATKARDEMLNETGPQKAFSPPGQLQLNEKAQPVQPEPVAQAQKAPEPAPQPAPQPAPAPQSASEPVPVAGQQQSQDAETHGPHWARHLDPASKVFNVAKSGPYVASSFNPLDNLSWKELETVYHFRVSSLKEVTKGLSGNSESDSKDASTGIWNAQSQKPAQHAASAHRPSSPRDTHPTVPAQPEPEQLRLTPPKQSYLDFDSPQDLPAPAPQETRQPPPDHMPAFGAGLHAESALDLDQMDIFEGLEDIEDLGHIDVIEDVQPSSTLYQTTGDYSPFEGPAYNYRPSPTESLTNLPAMKAPQPSVPELPPENRQPATTPPSAELSPEAAQADAPEPADAAKQDAGADTASQQAELADLIKSRIAQSKEMNMESEPVTTPPASEAPKPGLAGSGMKNKFIGKSAQQQAPAGDSGIGGGAAPAGGAGKAFTPKIIPPEIKKSLFVLGLRADDLTVAMVNEAWKKQITTPGVHPDQGGDTEYAVHLNTAKDTLIKWLDNQGPKLGKKFGGGGPKKPGS